MYNIQLGAWWAQSLINQDVILFDTETTGLGKKAQIVEIALVDGGAGTYLFNTLIKPTVKIEREAEKIHGISWDMVKDRPTMD